MPVWFPWFDCERCLRPITGELLAYYRECFPDRARPLSVEPVLCWTCQKAAIETEGAVPDWRERFFLPRPDVLVRLN